MSYIAFDLDALNVARDVGEAAGVPEERITHGLLRMWAWCFREKTDTVQAIQVQGFFGASAAPALVAFGFLAEVGNDYRVRGAERYLRIAEARSRGGKAASGNLVPGGRKSSVSRASSRGSLSAPAELQPSTTLGSTSALTPNTEHRAPSTEHHVEEALPPPPVVEKAPVAFVAPTTPPDTWSGEDFFAWAQSLRQKAGLVGERRRPRDLSSWWSTCLMTPGVTVARMQGAFLAFGDSKHWQSRTPALPFAGFVSQWDQFLGREVRHAS